MYKKDRLENISSEQIENIFMNLGLDIIICIGHSLPSQSA